MWRSSTATIPTLRGGGRDGGVAWRTEDFTFWGLAVLDGRAHVAQCLTTGEEQYL